MMTKIESQRVRELVARVETLSGRACARCARAVCGHEAVISIALGFTDAPHCLACLAFTLADEPAALRDHVAQHIRRRNCYRRGWLWASEREGFGAAVHPSCLWPSPDANEECKGGRTMTADTSSRAPVPDAEWDAGDMGCGDLVLELRLRLAAMPPGSILKVTAHDPGAPADLPAWCGMTRHTLLAAEHPTYWIKRKER